MIEKEILMKLAKSDFICQQKVKFDKDDPQVQAVFGDNSTHTLTFDLYDGLGYCSDYKGAEYMIQYPRIEFLKDCVEMSQAIREHNGLQDEDEINVTHIVHSYCQLFNIENFMEFYNPNKG